MDREDARRYLGIVGREALSPRRFVRSLARQPLEEAAARRIGGLPRVELADLVDPGEYQVSLAAREGRHAWSLGVVEQFILQLLIHQRSAAAAFEIGTFNGGSTRVIAEALPDEGRVVTLDLPPAEFAKTQNPDAFTGSDVGAEYRNSAAEYKIHQELCNSLEFDFGPYADGFDLVLVDGAHDYEHGYSDTQAALKIASAGGVILWDDFEPYWHGLVNGILDAIDQAPIGNLAGTSLGVLVVP